MHKEKSAAKVMWAVVLSLIPAGLAGVFIFGKQALWVITLGVLSAVVSEWILQVLTQPMRARTGLTKRKITVLDVSSVITGLLLAYNLPAYVPWWLPVIGSIFSIAIGKQLFGGQGQNIFNPALVGRVFLMASWPRYMVSFTRPLSYDAVTCATPLAMIKEGRVLENISYLDLFLGKKAGCIGEVCILALILGAVFLLLKGYISWHTPLTYVFTVGIMTYIFGPGGLFSGDWLLHILSGGLILGAFFMATDYFTSPSTRKGQVVFGAGCGLITAAIRLWGGYPEGVSFAILIMNAAVPIINRYTKTRSRIEGLKI